MSGIRIQLELDDGTFTTRMLHAGESVDRFNNHLGQTAVALHRIEPAHRSFIGHMRDVIVIVAAARLAFDNIRIATTGWVGEIVKVNAEFERLTILLKGMSTASDPLKEAKSQVQGLRDFAKEAPYSIKSLTDTFVKLRTTGIDPMQGSMKAVVDTVAAFGGNEDALKRATVALQQMAGKGVIQMEELRQQLGEHVPRAVEIMARSVGISIPMLLKTIGKGTLDAKSTLVAFYGELERTFGGAAQQQMNTFNGLISQTKTIVQTLALEIGDAGLFDGIKKQIKDLNEFLSGNAAKVLATGFGEAMTSIVEGLRSTIEWVVRFRNEIGSVIEILAVGFGVKILIGSLLTLGSTLGGVMTTLRVFRLEWTAMQTAMAFNRLDMIAGQLGVLGLGVSATTGAVRGLGIGLRFLGVSLAFVSEFALPLIVVITAAAYAFGLFSDEVEEAYQAAKKYGAEDEKQLAVAQQKLKVAEQELEVAERRAKTRGTVLDSMAGKNRSNELQDDVTKALKNRNEIELSLEEIALAYKTKVREKAVRADNAAIAEAQQKRTRAYDQEFNERAKAFEIAYNLRVKNNEDTKKLTEQYQRDNRAFQLQGYKQEFEYLESHLEEIKKRAAKGLISEDISNALTDNIIKRENAIQRSAQALSQQQLGPKEIEKGPSLKDALDKADSMLKTLNGNIAGAKAELAGANGELAKFIYSLEDGRSKKLNILGDAELDGKIAKLKELQKQYQELHAEVVGREKYDHDINAAAEKAAERRFAAENKNKSEEEKIAIRKKNGFYGGLRSTAQMQSSFQEAFAKIGTSATNAATGMETALGDKMQSKGQGMLGVIRSLAGAWNSFRFTADTTENKLLNDSVLANGGKPKLSLTGGPVDTKEETEKLRQIGVDNAAAALAESKTKLDQKIDEVKGSIATNNESLGKNNTHVRELTRAIIKGEYDIDRKGLGRDPNSSVFSDAMNFARKQDQSDRSHSRSIAATNKNEALLASLASDKDSLDARERDLQKRFEDESRTKQSGKKFTIATKYDKQINLLTDNLNNGIGNRAANEKALADLQDLKQRYIDVDAASVIQGEQRKNDAIEQSLMTADQARQFAHDKENQRLDQELEKVSKNSKFRAIAEETTAKAKILNDKKESLASPIGQMFKSWSDYGQNFQQASVSWMGSFSDELTKMVTKGKFNFKGLADSIIADMVRISIRGAIGNLLAPAVGISPTAASGGGAGKLGAVAQHHAGGIAGSIAATRMVDMSIFTNAQRLHTGGRAGFPGMKSNEVPIVAMNGEEVDWPSNLAKKYGGRGGSSIQNNVTVNATGGKPQDNQDLAERVGREVKASVSGMVIGELRTQARPGGLLHR